MVQYVTRGPPEIVFVCVLMMGLNQVRDCMDTHALGVGNFAINFAQNLEHVIQDLVKENADLQSQVKARNQVRTF